MMDIKYDTQLWVSDNLKYDPDQADEFHAHSHSIKIRLVRWCAPASRQRSL